MEDEAKRDQEGNQWYHVRDMKTAVTSGIIRFATPSSLERFFG